MMKRKTAILRSLALLLCAALCLTAAGYASTSKKPDFTVRGDNGSRTDDAVGFQLEPPADGEEIAVLETTEGVIKLRLFEKSAPIGVANFKGLIQKGYYDGITFHRICPDFMIQGGDPTGTGRGGESLWGEDFENEINANLLNLRGALSYANQGAGNPASNSSQFFIVQAKAVDESLLSGYGDKERALYQENGGTPWLDGVHPVFGQVFEGMDVVDAIAALGSEDGTPSKEVKIVKATLETYRG